MGRRMKAIKAELLSHGIHLVTGDHAPYYDFSVSLKDTETGRPIDWEMSPDLAESLGRSFIEYAERIRQHNQRREETHKRTTLHTHDQDGAGGAARATKTVETYTLRFSPRTDEITADGQKLQQVSYPLHGNPDGTIQRRDFWRGDPANIIGFTSRLDVMEIHLWWDDFIADPQKAVGMYVVTADQDDVWGTHHAAIASVEVLTS